MNLIIEGWKPLTVQFGYNINTPRHTFLVWRVVGTEHFFTIPLKDVTSRHRSKYEEHFEMTLIKLREDILEWRTEGLPEDWMVNYNNQYSKYLLI